MFENILSLSEIIDQCKKNEKILSDIKHCLDNKSVLNQFTNVIMDVSFIVKKLPCNNMFRQFINAKRNAQTMLNAFYNNEFHKCCLLLETFTDEFSTEVDIYPTEDEVITYILRYIILQYYFWIKEKGLSTEKQLERDRKSRFYNFENTAESVNKKKENGKHTVSSKLITESLSSNNEIYFQESETFKNFYCYSKLDNKECECCKNNSYWVCQGDQNKREDILSIGKNAIGRNLNKSENVRNGEKTFLDKEILIKGNIKKEVRNVNKREVWSCTYCTYDNKPGSDICRICRRLKKKRNQVDYDHLKKMEITKAHNEENRSKSREDINKKETNITHTIKHVERTQRNKSDIVYKHNVVINKDLKEEVNDINISICPFCLFNNGINKEKCEVCKNERETAEKKNGMKCVEWIQRNKSDIEYKLNNKMDKDLKEEAQGINIWICPFCSFNNEENKEMCEVCKEGRYYGKEDKNEDNINRDEIKSNVQNCSVLLISSELESKDSLKEISKDIERSTDISLVPEVKNDHFEEVKMDNKVSGDLKNIWECPSCTLRNGFKNKCCEVCFTFRKVADSVEQSEYEDNVEEEKRSNIWICTHCKKENLFDRYTCKECDNFAPFFNKWICDKCSFFNDELAPLCTVCGRENFYIKICNKCKKNIVKIKNPFCESCNSHKYEKREKTLNTSITNERKSNTYYCNNRWCGRINSSKNQHCSKCNLKKDANVTFFNTVDVFNGKTYIKMWQCTHCKHFNTKASCVKCKNLRHSPSERKCPLCHWVNKVIVQKCSNCSYIFK